MLNLYQFFRKEALTLPHLGNTLYITVSQRKISWNMFVDFSSILLVQMPVQFLFIFYNSKYVAKEAATILLLSWSTLYIDIWIFRISRTKTSLLLLIQHCLLKYHGWYLFWRYLEFREKNNDIARFMGAS